MNKESKEFLYEILNTPSPTGYEAQVQRVVRKRMEKYADVIESDVVGNLICILNPKAEKKVILTGHCDQIGFMVSHISADGFIYVKSVGGIDAGVVPGAYATIYGKKGEVQGVFGRKPIHKQTVDERKVLKLDITEAFIDIGAKDLKDAEKYVEIGDYVTYKLGVTELKNGYISSPALDNKAGLFCVMEALRLCAKSKLDVGLYVVSTVQEEIGTRGAQTASFGIDPFVGICVDVTFSTDNPGYNEKKVPQIELGKGGALAKGAVCNPVLYDKLLATAKKHKIPYQKDIAPNVLSNDTRALQITRSGVASACISVPNRYMHTQVEVCHLKDLETISKWIAEFVKTLSSKSDFVIR
ncbi:MAG: M42 family metallopeptidase [Bdellovibrionota bacterium]